LSPAKSNRREDAKLPPLDDVSIPDDVSVGSSFDSNLSLEEVRKDMDDTVKEGQAVLDLVSSKKRSIGDAQAPSKKEGLLRFSRQDDPLHLISRMPSNLQEAIMARPEKERVSVVHFYLDQYFKMLSPEQQADVQSKENLLTQVDFVIYYLKANEQNK